MATRRRKRNSRFDAEFPARQGRSDPPLLHPIQQRSALAHQPPEALRVRDHLVYKRTAMIDHVRGGAKALGVRLPAVNAVAFPARVAAHVPVARRAALGPLLTLTTTLRTYDSQLAELAQTTYAATARLRQIAGVVALTTLAYALLIDDPTRFANSRDVEAYVGLLPRLDENCAPTPQLRIMKAGDPLADDRC